MREADVEVILQRAKEKCPEAKPRIISDNGPQFIARDFKEFIRISGMTHVRTSPNYDSNRLDRDLGERYGIEMIAPHRGKRRTSMQDGRPLRRYRRCWRMERLFGSPHHFWSARDPLGVPHRERLWHVSPRVRANPVQVFLGPVLVFLCLVRRQLQLFDSPIARANLSTRECIFPRFDFGKNFGVCIPCRSRPFAQRLRH